MTKEALMRALEEARACIAEIDISKLPPEVASDVFGVCGYFNELIENFSRIEKPDRLHVTASLQLERGAACLQAFANSGHFLGARQFLFEAVFLAGAAAGQLGIVDNLMSTHVAVPRKEMVSRGRTGGEKRGEKYSALKSWVVGQYKRTKRTDLKFAIHLVSLVPPELVGLSENLQKYIYDTLRAEAKKK